jgi:serine/threonine-protein kinase HipA
MIFSLLASNYDDHPRNHGFLMHAPGRWSLSPAYDLNPVPEVDRARTHKTAITEDLAEPTLGAALAAAPRFGFKVAEATTLLREVFAVVSGWRNTGRRLRIRAATLEAYASAFEHPLMDEARRLLNL